MKKLLFFFLASAFFMLSACSEAAPGTSVSEPKADSEASDKQYPGSVTCAGYAVKTESGVFFVSDEDIGLLPKGSFSRIKPKEGVKADDLVTGEGIRVTVITVQESYPQQMDVYALEKTGESFEPDSDALSELDKLGWKVIR